MAAGELLPQAAVCHRGLVQGADQCLDVGFELGALFGVCGPQFLEPPDLPAHRISLSGVCPRARTFS
ncbi:hypothetical protein QFZ66_008430 [Streptomyces sp. B4I13]|nr:hypothetical protein [Streptomyces sp. B4I13]